jgi:hypothetical protein
VLLKAVQGHPRFIFRVAYDSTATLPPVVPTRSASLCRGRESCYGFTADGFRSGMAVGRKTEVAHAGLCEVCRRWQHVGPEDEPAHCGRPLINLHPLERASTAELLRRHPARKDAWSKIVVAGMVGIGSLWAIGSIVQEALAISYSHDEKLGLAIVLILFVASLWYAHKTTVRPLMRQMLIYGDVRASLQEVVLQQALRTDMIARRQPAEIGHARDLRRAELLRIWSSALRRSLPAIVAAVLLVVVAGAFAYWVWPTPYRYLGDLTSGGTTMPTREHRVTGCIELLMGPAGWVASPSCERRPGNQTSARHDTR